MTGERAMARDPRTPELALSISTPTTPRTCTSEVTQSCQILLRSSHYRGTLHTFSHDGGTSLIRNTALLGPYSRTMPRVLWWSSGARPPQARARAVDQHPHHPPHLRSTNSRITTVASAF